MTPPENLIALLESQLWCEVRPIIDFMRQLYNLNQLSSFSKMLVGLGIGVTVHLTE